MDAAIEVYLPEEIVESQLMGLGCSKTLIASMQSDPHVSFHFSKEYHLRITPLPKGFHQMILSKTHSNSAGSWQCIVIGGEGFNKIAHSHLEGEVVGNDYGLSVLLQEMLTGVANWIFYFSPKFDLVSRIERVNPRGISMLIIDSICFSRGGFIATP